MHLGLWQIIPYISADYQQIKKAFDSSGNIYPQGQGKLVVIYESG